MRSRSDQRQHGARCRGAAPLSPRTRTRHGAMFQNGEVDYWWPTTPSAWGSVGQSPAQIEWEQKCSVPLRPLVTNRCDSIAPVHFHSLSKNRAADTPCILAGGKEEERIRM